MAIQCDRTKSLSSQQDTPAEAAEENFYYTINALEDNDELHKVTAIFNSSIFPSSRLI